MSRFGLGRLLAAAIGAWLLVATMGAALAGYRAVETLVVTGGPLRIALLALALSLAAGYLTYRFGTSRLLAGIDAAPISRVRAPTVHASLDRLADRMDLPRPDLYVARFGRPNAFALGSRAIVVDRSLFRLLAPDELEAILAHELAHLEGRDSLIRTLAHSLSRTFALLVLFVSLPLVFVLVGAGWGLSLLFGRPLTGSRSVGYRARRVALGALAVLFIAPIVALRAYSRRREYAADDRATRLIDDPLALARALRKIQRASEPGWGLLSVFRPSRGDAERSRFERVFATHPPTDDRIERVREVATTRERERSYRIEIH